VHKFIPRLFSTDLGKDHFELEDLAISECRLQNAVPMIARITSKNTRKHTIASMRI